MVWLVAGIGIGAVVASVSRGIASQDAVRLSPQLYTVRFENDRVRVLEYHLKPGEQEPMHSHPAGVVYHLNDAIGKTVRPDGTSSVTNLTRGQVIWRELTTHTYENVGTTEVHALAIELK
jgi:hypothetical protein